MRGRDMVALGRVVLAERERVAMLESFDKGLVGTTLRYPYEVRDAEDYFDAIPDFKVAPDMLTLAEHILQSKEGDFDPSQFVDHYEEAVVEMLRKKQAGIPAARGQPASRPQNVINLMDAVRQSIQAEKRAANPAKKGGKQVEGQREMLLPIPGRKIKEVAGKPAAKPDARQKESRLGRSSTSVAGFRT